MELSAGQYQLDRDNRNDLIVIDHQDAGASRPVHTLSDGETFQASLALALALSRQVIGLSAGIGNLITSETHPRQLLSRKLGVDETCMLQGGPSCLLSARLS